MNIYVSHLSWGTSSEGLGNLFMQFGEVASANVITDRETGRSRGFGFVEMPNEEESGRLPVSAALGSCGKGNRLACALWEAVVYMGFLSCVSSILLSVAALPEKASCPIPAACSGVGTLPTASGQVVPK